MNLLEEFKKKIKNSKSTKSYEQRNQWSPGSSKFLFPSPKFIFYFSRFLGIFLEFSGIFFKIFLVFKNTKTG